MDTADAVVVGGGPGGLGTAGLLTKTGTRVVLLERGEGVGSKWRSSYDRLRINTSALTSYLPGKWFPRSVGLWASRDELVRYYERYAAARDIDVRPNHDVTGIDWRHGRWVVTSSRGQVMANNVVIATGRDGVPRIPDWPGRDIFGGTIIHSSEYRNPRRFEGQRILVVGAGNSGSDIAVDLIDGGASWVGVAIRTPPHIVSRSVGHIPSDVLQVLGGPLPDVVVDRLGEAIRRRRFGDLEKLGLQRPALGIKTSIRVEGRVPTIDAGPFTQAVRGGRIQIVGALVELSGRQVIVGENRIEVDAIIAATGYDANLAFLEHLGVLDTHGRPDWGMEPASPSYPGLYVIGFGDLTRGNLRGLRLDARKVARAIKRRQREARPISATAGSSHRTTEGHVS